MGRYKKGHWDMLEGFGRVVFFGCIAFVGSLLLILRGLYKWARSYINKHGGT